MKLNRLSSLATLVLGYFFISYLAMGQTVSEPAPFPPSKQMFGPPLFLYDTYYFLSPDSAKNGFDYRLDVYVAFANDILQFVKERPGNFTAGYDLYVSIFDHKRNLIADKTTSKKINVQSFEATNERELNNRHRLSFNLIAGAYKLALDLTDLDTQKSLHREKEIKIEGFDSNNISVSEILFADKVVFDSSQRVQEVIPNLDRNFREPSSDFWAYFEIYPQSARRELKLIYTVTDATDQAVIRNERILLADKKIIPYLLDLSKEIKTPGRYTLIVQIEAENKNATARARFSANWSNFEFSRLNINTAIETLKEFITEKDLKTLEQASDSVKEAWFQDYWKKRDPTPDTKSNELQEEFYRRVDFANNFFGVNALDKEGWKTDRGNIYIKYGPPTDVERHQDQLNLPPYEIWYYSKIERRFFFQDKSGVGDFQLVRME